MALSQESVSMTSGFGDGIEFEETFPEPVAAPVAEPEPPAALPRLIVVPEGPEAPAETGAGEALYQRQLERRLREAEELVKQTVARMRLEEEQRLVEWMRRRREEEERRIQSWAEERRTAVERTLDQRRSTEEQLAEHLREMLAEWEARFEQRLEQRRAVDERDAERRRAGDEERLRAWREELESALSARFASAASTERAPLPDRNGELRSAAREAIDAAPTARDVGRVLRDALGELARTSALALAIHHTDRPEVAYRYRVAADDEVGRLLRTETLDDGPESPAACMDGWVRAHRAARAAGRVVTVHTAQTAVRDGDELVGVLTLQTEESAVADPILARVNELVRLAAPRLAALRRSSSFRGA